MQMRNIVLHGIVKLRIYLTKIAFIFQVVSLLLEIKWKQMKTKVFQSLEVRMVHCGEWNSTNFKYGSIAVVVVINRENRFGWANNAYH